MEHVEHVRRGFHHILPRRHDAALAHRLDGRRPRHILRRHHLLVPQDTQYSGCQ